MLSGCKKLDFNCTLQCFSNVHTYYVNIILPPGKVQIPHDCTMHLSLKTTGKMSQTLSGASRPRAPALVAVRSWRWEFVLRTRRSGAWVFHQCVQQFNLSRREKHRLALITAQFRQVPVWGWKWTSPHSSTRLACDASSINKADGFPATLLQCVMCAASPLWAAVTIKPHKVFFFFWQLHNLIC